MSTTHPKGRRQIPEAARPYRRTPVFTAGTVPAGLTRDHKTRAGIWGLIHVSAGSLCYRIAETGEEFTLTAGDTAVVEPEVPHAVSLSHDAVFQVEFWH